MPKIVVSIDGNTSIRHIQSAIEDGLDIAELRIDLIDNPTPLFKALASVPILLTIRSIKQGGLWSGSIEERIALYQKYIPLSNIIDIEVTDPAKDILEKMVRNAGKTVLFSLHDFDKTPPLESLLQIATMVNDGDILKVATKVNDQNELWTLVEFLQAQRNCQIVVIGMGDLGSVSRVFFPALGSIFTFSFLGKATAPGQFNLADTKRMLQTFY